MVCRVCGATRCSILFTFHPEENFGLPVSVLEIWRCAQCRFVFSGLDLNRNLIGRLYERPYFESEGAVRATDPKVVLEYYRHTLATIEAMEPPGHKLLDVGCGDERQLRIGSTTIIEHS